VTRRVGAPAVELDIERGSRWSRRVPESSRAPDRRAIASLWIFVSLLAAVAAVALVVGVHDAGLAGSSIGLIVSSGMLIAVGVVLLVVVVQLVGMSRRDRWEDGKRPPCKPLVLVGFLLTILLGVYALISAARAGGAQRSLVIAVSVGLLALGIAGLRFFGNDAPVTLPRIGGIVLGLVGTLFAAWQFWYQNQFVPTRAGRAVALKAQLSLDGRQGTSDVVRARLEYEDVGGSSVAAIGSAYTLTGSRLVRCRRAYPAEAVKNVYGGFLVDPQRSRYMTLEWEEQPPELLATGKFVGDGKRLDPHVSGSRDLVFLVPHGRYQLLRLRAQLFAIPATVTLSTRTLPRYEFLDDNALYGFWHVEDDSWLHDLLYGRDRWVVLRYDLVNRFRNRPPPKQTAPDIRVSARFPDPTWRSRRPSDEEAKQLFEAPAPSDASEPFANSELAVGDLVERTRQSTAPETCR
jgi:hypothetical protein